MVVRKIVLVTELVVIERTNHEMNLTRRKSFLLLASILLAVGVWATSRNSHPRPRVNQNNSSKEAPHGLGSIESSFTQPAQSLPNISTDRHVVAGGGATSNGGSITVDGTVGEPSASRTMSGGSLTLNGGFWNTLDAPGASNFVLFSSQTYNVVEGCTSIIITVNRVGDTSGAAKVDYSTSNGTATDRGDYIIGLGRLEFAAGETAKSFAVLINADSLVEGNETFNVNLSNPSGVGLGTPSTATVTIIDSPPADPTRNVIDDPQTYVCQHYHDFLNRQPDASGFLFWTNEITSCGTNQSCIEIKRINVSAAFYLSIEFQQTGFLVERLYKAAFGDATGNSTFPSAHQLAVPFARLKDFQFDTQKIGQGVIVNQGNWETVLENNKQAFTDDFVQRSGFTNAFPASMSAAQYVDQLNTNAGNPLSPAERDVLVSQLQNNVRTRAQVLRAVAENQNLVNAEFNRAFVLMQYIGYLRRNPNDPQDSDYTGYDFWLTKLNQFNGNFIEAEMVKAFLSSAEYRQRFALN